MPSGQEHGTIMAASSSQRRGGARTKPSAVRLLLLACLLAAPARAETVPPPGKLQLYVMPDTQAWSWDQDGTTLATWRAVTRALCQQRSRFAMVLHTGDLVDHPGRPAEWSNALSVMQQLDACQMPYAIAFGNHDFDNHPPAQGVALQGDRGWKAVMAKLHYRPSATAPSGRTALYPLAPGWFVVTADFTASRADLDWIDTAIGERREAAFVFLNHHCVSAVGLVQSAAFEWCRQLFERHPQIRVAVSGHWLGPTRDGWRDVTRASGGRLVTLFQNYQHVPDLAAWGVVVELDPASGALCVWSENLLNGAVTHPAASSQLVGRVAGGPGRRCFGASAPKVPAR